MSRFKLCTCHNLRFSATIYPTFTSVTIKRSIFSENCHISFYLKVTLFEIAQKGAKYLD